MEMEDAQNEVNDDENNSDPRLNLKITSWIVAALGTIVGIIGLIYIIMELKDGAKQDSA